ILFLFVLLSPPRSVIRFPYTTLFRSFERHLATEACILGQKDFTHAAAPDAAQYLVMTDLFAYDRTRRVTCKHLGSRFSSHGFDGITSFIVRRDERFNFAAQRRIVGAG